MTSLVGCPGEGGGFCHDSRERARASSVSPRVLVRINRHNSRIGTDADLRRGLARQRIGDVCQDRWHRTLRSLAAKHTKGSVRWTRRKAQAIRSGRADTCRPQAMAAEVPAAFDGVKQPWPGSKCGSGGLDIDVLWRDTSNRQRLAWNDSRTSRSIPRGMLGVLTWRRDALLSRVGHLHSRAMRTRVPSDG